mmetsp:Transcript_30957/g.45903  ORF Transcript_30957/g.45903 Transcript_30957/m.45903 type:complete len:490 (+) Transcript_30957:188-1657(+)
MMMILSIAATSRIQTRFGRCITSTTRERRPQDFMAAKIIVAWNNLKLQGKFGLTGPPLFQRRIFFIRQDFDNDLIVPIQLFLVDRSSALSRTHCCLLLLMFNQSHGTNLCVQFSLGQASTSQSSSHFRIHNRRTTLLRNCNTHFWFGIKQMQRFAVQPCFQMRRQQGNPMSITKQHRSIWRRDRTTFSRFQISTPTKEPRTRQNMVQSRLQRTSRRRRKRGNIRGGTQCLDWNTPTRSCVETSYQLVTQTQLAFFLRSRRGLVGGTLGRFLFQGTLQTFSRHCRQGNTLGIQLFQRLPSLLVQQTTTSTGGSSRGGMLQMIVRTNQIRINIGPGWGGITQTTISHALLFLGEFLFGSFGRRSTRCTASSSKLLLLFSFRFLNFQPLECRPTPGLGNVETTTRNRFWTRKDTSNHKPFNMTKSFERVEMILVVGRFPLLLLLVIIVGTFPSFRQFSWIDMCGCMLYHFLNECTACKSTACLLYICQIIGS